MKHIVIVIAAVSVAAFLTHLYSEHHDIKNIIDRNDHELYLHYRSKGEIPWNQLGRYLDVALSNQNEVIFCDILKNIGSKKIIYSSDRLRKVLEQENGFQKCYFKRMYDFRHAYIKTDSEYIDDAAQRDEILKEVFQGGDISQIGLMLEAGVTPNLKISIQKIKFPTELVIPNIVDDHTYKDMPYWDPVSRIRKTKKTKVKTTRTEYTSIKLPPYYDRYEDPLNVFSQLADARVAYDVKYKEYNDYHTILIDAVKKDNPALVELLLDHGADIKFKTKDGKSAIDFAKNDEIRFLLESHGNSWNPMEIVIAKDKNNFDLLKKGIGNDKLLRKKLFDFAIELGSTQATKYFYTDLDMPFDKLDLALATAVFRSGSVEQMAYFIQKGLDIDQVVPYIDLIENYQLKELAMRQTTISRMVDDVRKPRPENMAFSNALYEVATKRNMTAMASVLDAHINKWTPFQRAAVKGNVLLLAQLIGENNNHLHARDANGRTALQLAIIYKNNESFNYLIGLKQDFNLEDNKKMTALMYAIAYIDLDMVGMLLQQDVSLSNSSNSSCAIALHFADRNYRRLVRTLSAEDKYSLQNLNTALKYQASKRIVKSLERAINTQGVAKCS